MPEYLVEREPAERRWVTWKNFLIVVLIILLVSGIAIGALNYFQRKEDLCLTENCLKAALHIVSSLDTSQDPCYDFYQFTCGNFINKAYENNIPAQYYAQILSNKHKLNAIIAEPITGDETGLYLQQKKFYKSCLDVEAIDAEGIDAFKKLLDELGGWPVIEGQNWREEDFELSDIIIKCMNLGLPFQSLFRIRLDYGSLIVDVPNLIKQYNETYRKSAYINLIDETVIAFGGPKDNEMKNVLNFEEKLLAAADEKDAVIMMNMDLEDLSSTFPVINWFELLNNITENYTISENDTVEISGSYLRKLNLLMAKTPKRVQANFIIWKILEEFGFYLSKPIRYNFLNFTSFMTNSEKPVHTRFEFCIKESIERFPRIAETEFIRKYISDEKIEEIKEIISNIKNQFIIKLTNADWIVEPTKEEAINKINNIIEILVEHDLTFDENVVKEFLGLTDLEFTTNNVIDMLTKRNIDIITQTFNAENTTSNDALTSLIFSKTLDVNAAYITIPNIIFLTAGMIQNNFHALSRPNYLNYGALGTIISHEIAHALNQDEVVHGSEEEKEIMIDWFNGTMEEVKRMMYLDKEPLWQNQSLETLETKMKCIINTMAGSEGSDNFDRVLIENFADLVGIDKAYEAYVDWARGFEEEQQLPGLPFSPTQLFWIQFGATNCYRKLDSIGWIVSEDDHASLRYRIMNMLQNSENFAKDFQCPEGSIMNPIEKCHVF